MAKLDVLNQNTMPKNIKNIDSNFTELYNTSITGVTLDGESVVTDRTAQLNSITTTDIDALFTESSN